VLEARSGTKFLTNSANPTLWTLFGSHKELGGASNYVKMNYKTMLIIDGTFEKFKERLVV
jgi:hypothetical protein